MKTNEQTSLPLSVVIISRNEEANIERALKSVSWVQDIVVYDSGSTDSTCEIATKMGAKVIRGDWFGFGKTKALATKQARHEWVLSIDCDEEVTPELKAEIEKKWPSLNSKIGYKLPRKSLYLGRWISYGGWYPDYQLRLFNQNYSQWDEAEIHEKIKAPTEDFLVSPLNHYVFKNIEHQVNTNNRYSTLQAQNMFMRGQKFSWFHFLTKPMVKFIECYLWKKGFLDGWPGFVIAKSAGYSVFLKWAKLRELEKNNV